MPGVYAKRLCTMQSPPSIHNPSPRGRGLGMGLESLHYFQKIDFFDSLKSPASGRGFLSYNARLSRLFAVDFLLQNIQHLSEPLEVHHLALTQELYDLLDVGVVTHS